MNCPSCERPLDKLYVNAPATVTILQTVGAELEPSDLGQDNLRLDYLGKRVVTKFALDEQLETLDNNIEHAHLEIDHEDAFFYCPHCNELLSRETFEAWLEEAAAWLRLEPADREP